MALKAGRVGVNPADVDPVDGHISPSSMEGYTKQEADAKFSTKDELRIAINDVDLLMGSKLTNVYADMGVLGAKNFLPNNFEQGAIAGASQSGLDYADLKTASNNRIRTKDLVSLVSDKRYKIVVDFNTYEINAQPFDASGKSIYPTGVYNTWKSSAFEIDTLGSVKKVAIAIRRKDGADLTPSDYSSAKPMIYLASDPDDTYVRPAKTNLELTAEVTPIEGTITSDFTVNAETLLMKVGKVVVASVRIDGVTKEAYTQSLFDIPAGFRPKTNITVPFAVSDNNFYGGRVIIGASGLSQVSKALSNVSIFFSTSWITEE